MSFGKRRNTILSRFLISYILILAIPLILSLIIYAKTIEMVEEDIKKSNLSMLEQSRDIIDRHLQEADAMVERVALHPKVVSLTYMNELREGSADIDLLINAVNDLSVYRLTNSFVREFFIHFKKSDIVMMTSAANTKMRLLYGNYFRFGNMSYEEWLSSIAAPLQVIRYIPSTPVHFNGRTYPVITRLQSIPLEHPKSNRGCIMVFIDTSAVNQLLQKINVGTTGYTYILDNDNTMITSVCPDGREARILDISFEGNEGVMHARVSGEDMVVSYTASSLNGWKYVTAVPSGFVMKKVNYIRTIILSAALAFLLFGFILSCYLSYKNAKPIKDISDSLRELLGDNNGYKNEYTFLSGSITSLISSNKDLGKKLDEQMPLIRAAFLKRLLYGCFRDMDEINTNLSHLGIQLPGSGYIVMILKIFGYRDLINKNILKELDISRLIINRAIEDKSGGKVASCDLDETKIALLLSFDTDDPAEMRIKVEDMAEELFREFQNQHKIYVSFAAGNICSSLVDIGYSFTEAKQALDYIMTEHEQKLVWYCQIPKQRDRYLYTIDMEKKLMDLAKSGDSEELKKLLKNIYLENFARRKLPGPMQRLFIYQMTGTLTRFVEQVGGDDPEKVLNDISYADEAEYAYQSVCRYFQEYCDSVNIRKSSSDDVLREKVLHYLDEVYMNEDLTLYHAASHFSLTETYLYHFFKEKIGMTFASYLEKLRMDRAYSLLIETQLSINEIAIKVGYGSVHSFRRAFKRCKGYIPSELRNA